MQGDYGTVRGSEGPSPAARHGAPRNLGRVMVATAAVVCAALAVAVAEQGPASSRPVAMESILGHLNEPFAEPNIGLSMKRARTDIDPGSLTGLLAAAQGKDATFSSDGSANNAALSSGRVTQLGQESAIDALAALQQKTMTNKVAAGSRSRGPKTRAVEHSLGKTIAQFFTTVRSVKDDQGTFLG